MRCLICSLFASLCFTLLLPVMGMAQQATPVIFTRTDIRIEPLPIKGKDGEASLLRPESSYNVELRSEEALQLEYIHTLNDLTDTTGVMVMFNAPTVAPLPAFRVYTKVDALFIAEDGTILQILPGVALGEMTQDVYADEPVKAFLFLKQGQVAARMIRPHDSISGDMFIPAPPVMQ